MTGLFQWGNGTHNLHTVGNIIIVASSAPLYVYINEWQAYIEDLQPGDIGTQWILDLCNGIVKEGSIPEDWKSSVVLPIYKGKGDPMECGSYRGIMILCSAIILPSERLVNAFVCHSTSQS